MKMKIIKKLNILFAIMLIFSISVATYADDTTNNGIIGIGEKQGDENITVPADLTVDDFPEFYKTFIIELGGERMQVFNATGAKVYEKVVLPAEFKGKSNITLENKFIRNEQTIILANEYSIGLGGYAFSNNIPCLTFIGSDFAKPDYVLFKSWTNMTTSIAEWCSNPENAKNLVADINDNILNEVVGNDILTFLSGGGSIVFEPVSFYPESTEQIYVNTLQIAKDHGMQFNEAFLNSFTQIKAQLEAELKNTVKHYSKAELQTTNNV